MKRIFQIICVFTIVFSLLFTVYGSIKLAQASETPVTIDIVNSDTGNTEFVAEIPYATLSVENSQKIVTISLVTLIFGTLGIVGTSKTRSVSK